MLIGTDIVDNRRIKSVLEKHGERFLKRIYSDKEVAYCSGKENSHEHYAGKFAGKEAVYKALSDYYKDHPFRFSDIQILNRKNGKPYVLLSEELQKLCPIKNIEISISHERNYSIAVVVAI